eukprot:GEMP01003944.1.p1 GENE.GEMP01003944.1~~GEMP01003944.1.p1  ORF type:complete len:949 (+),score=245.38 GEMP01003944.1:69-2915(+)
MKPVLSSDAIRILGSDVIDLLRQHFNGYTTSVMTYAQFTRASAAFGFATATSLQKAYRRHSCGAGLTFDDFLASVCSLEGSSHTRPWTSPQVAKAVRDRCMRGKFGTATSINASAQRLRAAFKQPGGVVHFASALEDFERKFNVLSSGARMCKGANVTNRRRNLASSPFVQAVFKAVSVPMKSIWSEFCGSRHAVSGRGFMTCEIWLKVAGFFGIPYTDARDVFDQGQQGAQQVESKMSYDGFQAALCYWCQRQSPPQLGEGVDVCCARRLRKLLLEDNDVRSIQLPHRIRNYLHPDPITDLLRVSANAVCEPRMHAAELATKIAGLEDREVAALATEFVRVLETDGDSQAAYETLVAHTMTAKPKSAATYFTPLARKNPQLHHSSRIPAPKSALGFAKKSRLSGVTSGAVRDKNRLHVKAPPLSAISGRPPLPPPKMTQAVVTPAAAKVDVKGPPPSRLPNRVHIPAPLDEITTTPTSRAAREIIAGSTPVSTVGTPSSVACSWHLPTPTAQVVVRDSLHDLRDSVDELKFAMEQQDELLVRELVDCIAEQAAGMAQEATARVSAETPLVQSPSSFRLDRASLSRQNANPSRQDVPSSPGAHGIARGSVRASVSGSLGNGVGGSVSRGVGGEVQIVSSSPRVRGSVKLEIVSSPQFRKSVERAQSGEDIGSASYCGSVGTARSPDERKEYHLTSPMGRSSMSGRVEGRVSEQQHSASPGQSAPPTQALSSPQNQQADDHEPCMSSSSICPSSPPFAVTPIFDESDAASPTANRTAGGAVITSPSSVSSLVIRTFDERETTSTAPKRASEDILIHPSSPSATPARKYDQPDAPSTAAPRAATEDDITVPSFSPPDPRKPDESASARSSLEQSVAIGTSTPTTKNRVSRKEKKVCRLLESLSRDHDAASHSVTRASNNSQQAGRSSAQDDEPDNTKRAQNDRNRRWNLT